MSVNFIKEVDELLEVDLVAGLHAHDFNHCCNLSSAETAYCLILRLKRFRSRAKTRP
jgi:hypothetical protein